MQRLEAHVVVAPADGLDVHQLQLVKQPPPPTTYARFTFGWCVERYCAAAHADVTHSFSVTPAMPSLASFLASDARDADAAFVTKMMRLSRSAQRERLGNARNGDGILVDNAVAVEDDRLDGG